MFFTKYKLVKSLFVFLLIFCVGVGEVRASDSVEKRGFYLSPRCKRALRGLAISASVLTALGVGRHYYGRYRVHRAMDELAEMAPRTPLLPSPSSLMPLPPPLLAPSTRELSELLKMETVKSLNDYLAKNPITLTIPIKLESIPLSVVVPDNEDKPKTLALLKSTLSGFPGELIPLPNSDELKHSPTDLPTIFFHAAWSTPSAAALKSGFHVRADATYDPDELMASGKTGLEQPIIADLVAIQKSLIPLHPVTIESRIAQKESPLEERPERFTQFLRALEKKGPIRKYWNEVLGPELRKDNADIIGSKLVYTAVAGLADANEKLRTQALRPLGNLLAQNPEKLRSVLLRLRQHAAELALEIPEISESRDFFQDLMSPLGTDKEDYRRELERGETLVSFVQERQFERLILKEFERARTEKRDLHVYLSVVETIRLARFTDRIFQQASVPSKIYIVPWGFELSYEILEGDYTNEKLLELAKPFQIPDSALRTLEEPR